MRRLDQLEWKGTSRVKACHTVRPVFDDRNLVSAAGLVPLLRLAETAGLHEMLGQGLTVTSANAAAKTACVVGGMLAGADSIDDLGLLRHGAMSMVFGGVRAPSTLGTFLSSFTHGHVQQLDRVGAQVLTGLAGRVPALLTGPAASPGSSAAGAALTLIDVDDTIREVHGYGKQAAGFGYSKVRGLNVQLATISSGRGETTTAPAIARADSAYYGHAFVSTARRHNVRFSVTARMNPSLRTAIAGIDEQAWTAIQYPNAVFDQDENRWVSDAEIAEVGYVAFTGRRKADHVACRLVVRRVRRLQPLAHDGTAQGELFATWRHHAFITDTDPADLDTAAADRTHRGHAIVEQVIAELKDGPLAHLPSGNYAANAAWLSCAVIAFNLARAAAVAADQPTARWATIRTRLINIAARIATTGRRRILHLPADWAWADSWQTLWEAATGPPATATT